MNSPSSLKKSNTYINPFLYNSSKNIDLNTFGSKFISVILVRLELNLIPNTLKSSFVHCILKLGHKISLLPDFDPRVFVDIKLFK